MRSTIVVTALGLVALSSSAMAQAAR